MKEHHAAALALAYYASVVDLPDYDQNSEDILRPYVPKVFASVPTSVLVAIPITLSAALVTRIGDCAFAHAMAAMSFVAFLRGGVALLSNRRTPSEWYLNPAVLLCSIVSMFRFEHMRKNMALMYAACGIYATVLVSKGSTTSSRVFEDFVLCHLAFYFTK